METDLEIIPRVDFEELTSGVSAEGIRAFVAGCCVNSGGTRHLFVPGDPCDTLSLLPEGVVDLTTASVFCGGRRAEKSFAEFLETMLPLLSELYRVTAPEGTLAIHVSPIRVGSSGSVALAGGTKGDVRTWPDLGRFYREGDMVPIPSLIAEKARKVGFFVGEPEVVVQEFSLEQRHEEVLILTKGRCLQLDRRRLTAAGVPTASSVVVLPRAEATYGHARTFHPFLAERYIAAATREASLVLDFWSGLGSTALSALKLGRNSISLELDPESLEIARDRLAHFASAYGAVVEWAAPSSVEGAALLPHRSPIPRPEFRPHASDSRYMRDYLSLPRCPNAPPETDEALSRETAFPLHCLAPFQQHFVEELVRLYGADSALAAVACLGIWSASLGKHWVGLDGVLGRATYGNLHIVAALPTGAGKGVADLVAAPLLECERVMQRYARRNGALVEPSFVVDSATGAAIFETLKAGDDALALYSSEAGGLFHDLKVASRTGSGNLFDLLLKGYSVQWCREDKVSRGRYQGQPALTVLWLAQPMLARELVSSSQFRDRGLAGRWLVFERSQQLLPYDDGVRITPNQEIIREWRRHVRRVLAPRILVGPQQPIEHRWSPAAQGVFTAHHNRIVHQCRHAWKGHEALFVRSRENAIRIALGLLAAAVVAKHDVRGEDDARFAERAVTIMVWFEAERFRFFVGSDEDALEPLRVRAVDLLLRQRGQMAVRDCDRRHGINEAKARELVRVFPQLFSLEKQAKHTGRPSLVLRLRLEA